MKTKCLFVTSLLAVSLLTGCNSKTKWTVTFDDGNNNITSQIVLDGDLAIKPADPVKQGNEQYSYEFLYWKNGEVEYDFSTPVTSNLELVAEYSQSLVSYVVSFNSNGGTSVNSQTVNYGEVATEPTAINRDSTAQYNYTFDGWYLGNEKYDFSTPVTTDITLDAHWKDELREYNVTFVGLDGQVIKVVKYKYGQTPTYDSKLPTIPADEQFEYEVTWDKAFAPVEGDVTYTLISNKVLRKYTVTFDTLGHGAIESQQVNYGEKVVKVDDPVYTTEKGTYLFNGWLKDGKPFDIENDVVKGDITLTASYGYLSHRASYNPTTKTYKLEKVSDANYTDVPYIDLGDDFTNGASISITFKGINKPQVAFYSGEPTKNMLTETVTGPIFTSDLVSGDFRIFPSTNITTGAILANKDEWRSMSYNSLNSYGRDNTYEMVLSTVHDEENSKWYVTGDLYQIEADGTKTIITSGSNRYNRDLTEGGKHIVLYGSRLGECEFSFSYTKTNTYRSGYAKESGNFFIEKNKVADANYTDVSYIDLGDEFTNGAKLTFRLNGEHNIYLPTVQFFTDVAERGFKTVEKNGLVFHGDSIGSQYRVYPSSALTNAFVTSQTAYAGYNPLNAAGRMSHELELVLNVIKNESSYTIGISLKDISTNEDLGSYTHEYPFTTDQLKGKLGTGSHIVIYGSRVSEIQGFVTAQAVK